MNEADTRAELIDPALKEAGWGVVEGSRVRREVITLGRLQARFAYATNGVGIYRVDMHTGEEGLVSGYPTPPAPCPVCGEVPCQCGGGGEQRVVEIELAARQVSPAAAHERYHLLEPGRQTDLRRRLHRPALR